MNTIDVYIFTGFLGSGKTTLLNSLLSKIAKTKKIVVIENEIGEVNIDSKLINNLSHYTYELTQGCICCSLSDDLYDILFQIYESNSKPDVVVIETTGIADVGSLSVILKSNEVRKYFNLKLVFCVVDSENIEDRIQEHIEVSKQIAGADVLILNKIQKVHQDYVVYLNEMFNKIQPFAKVVISQNGEFDEKWLELNVQTKPKFFLASSEIKNEHYKHQINSFTYRTNSICDLNKLQLVMQMYFLQYPNQLLRVKGFVKTNLNKMALIQSTGKYVSTEIVGDWPVSEQEHSELVFIGNQIRKDTFERILRPIFS